MRDVLADTRICRECGKEIYFLNFSKWAWKKIIGNRIMYFCSYTCMRRGEEKAKKELHAKQRAAREKKRQRRAML